MRWNSLADSLRAYITNWPILVAICEEHREEISPEIARKVKDYAIKRNTEDYLQRMTPIAVALDKAQSDSCTLAQGHQIWHALETEIDPALNHTERRKLQHRKDVTITAAHYLAVMLTPGENCTLSEAEIDAALEYLGEYYPSCVSTVMNYRSKSGPFKLYMFTDCFTKTTPLAWWKSFKDRFSSDFNKFITALYTSRASSASVERVFSTFGFVHSKVRNRLGVDKAAKLTFMYRVLNHTKEQYM